jgi:hypothetical protein
LPQPNRCHRNFTKAKNQIGTITSETIALSAALISRNFEDGFEDGIVVKRSVVQFRAIAILRCWAAVSGPILTAAPKFLALCKLQTQSEFSAISNVIDITH